MAKQDIIFPLTLAGLAFLVFGGSSEAESSVPSADTGDPGAYIKKYLPLAKETEQLYAVPALFTLAQAGLESAWGSSRLAKEANNHFAIKADSKWFGPYITLPEGKFRKYSTVKDSYYDHAKFLTTNSRYNGAFSYSSTPYQFMQAVAAAGYAEDPSYSTLLNNVMDSVAARAGQMGLTV